MRVLLDTNVVVSAILFGGLPRRLLNLAIGGRLEIVTSPHLLDELEGVLADTFDFSRAAASETRAELEVLAGVVTPKDVPRVCRDPDDDHVLAAGLAGRAIAIVTGDRDLLVLGSYEGIEIIEPSELAARIGD